MMSEDWSEADLVFVSSLTFSDSLLESIIAKGAALKIGAKFVTLRLPSISVYEAYYELVRQVPTKMSWGRVMAYVLVRIAKDVELE